MARWLILFLAACGSDVTSKTITEISDVCVDGNSLKVTFLGCLSSSCDSLASATCTITAAGDVLTVTGEAVVDSQGDICTDDCGFIQATCALDASLDRDATTVTFGGDDGGPTLADAACSN